MKIKNIKSLLVIGVLVLVAATGCKKEDFDINRNPDDITESSVDFRTVLPSALANSATAIEGENWKWLQNWMGWWARSGSFQDLTDEETYSFDNDFGATIWNSFYANANNYNFVAKRANEAGAGHYEAIARIMKAHCFQILVDVYGNIPYSEALQGGANRTPKYDDAMEIYEDLFRELDASIALLKDPAAIDPDLNSGIDQNDLVFHGDAEMWVKFANTLKLRMLMHVFQAPGFDVTGEAAIIMAEGSGFLGNDEDAILNPGYSATKPSPFYRAYVTTEDGAAARFANLEKANAYAVGPVPTHSNVGWYSWNGDPRIDKFYTLPQDGSPDHNGIPYGEIAGTNPDNEGAKLSQIAAPGLIPNGPSSRAWIMTAAESFFLQAEAVERGIITSSMSVEDLVTQGVYESFKFLGLTTAEADAYFTANAGYSDTDVNGPAGAIYTILAQKWFSLNAIAPFEVWTDYRRTDIVYGVGGEFAPGPPISVNPANTRTSLPVRLFYPQNEYNYNAANVATQGNGGVINVFTNRIFWDIN